ncbi:class I SAM-dependent methyltransferase [Pseudidiomarina woesei]|uniref:Predicted methyltransferase n=1 Tax=Pseudidiomarina woesei TaxID=1381080 RepID=A0A0K6H334_9GAMM|nr:methyltransferase domain-containing protein [Pseudidiomarina woesei]CUA85393.1 Predicted methyltransferase [Pseudidiomarina woesei]
MTVKSGMLTSLVVSLAVVGLWGCSNDQSPQSVEETDSLATVVASTDRSDANRARDDYRHPYETLQFFGIQPDMTVVEISPGGGWYTEILAPYLKQKGTLYAAHFPSETNSEFYQRSRARFIERVSNDANFSNVIVTEFSPTGTSLIAPANSADLVLTFRNLHNWYMGGSDEAVQQAFRQFYNSLKPGGVLGVVDHRLPETRPDTDMENTGYMKESYAIAIAEAVGFELLERSEINANPNDSADHPRGVWTLPPTLRLGDENRDDYLAIGESDRFTLKFVKPKT